MALDDDGRLRVALRFMGGYGHDDAQAELGFEKQGRIGYAIVELFGAATSRVSYRFVINPVDEGDPRPACGEEHFFYPNNPAFLGQAGPAMAPCESDGNRRVDMYKSIALDPMNQQGPIREAYVQFATGFNTSVRFGRFILPLGFGWEEAGSLNSKDATRIQRINAESNTGLMLGWRTQAQQGGRPLLAASASGVLGDGNRNRDYDYFYFERSDLDSNSALTTVFSVQAAPTPALDLRVSAKRGFSGSKVERLPNYWASKRNDHAIIASGRYRFNSYAGVFGEYARYTWGPAATSAEMLGFNQDPVIKDGFYAGVEAGYPVRKGLRVAVSATREQLSRDDSLVKYFVETGSPLAAFGETDEGTILRLLVDVGDDVRLGFYRNFDDTAFPWLSGIAPVSGPRAFQFRGTNKWGLVARVAVE